MSHFRGVSSFRLLLLLLHWSFFLSVILFLSGLTSGKTEGIHYHRKQPLSLFFFFFFFFCKGRFRVRWVLLASGSYFYFCLCGVRSSNFNLMKSSSFLFFFFSFEGGGGMGVGRGWLFCFIPSHLTFCLACLFTKLLWVTWGKARFWVRHVCKTMICNRNTVRITGLVNVARTFPKLPFSCLWGVFVQR